jgi:hypothetical protein
VVFSFFESFYRTHYGLKTLTDEQRSSIFSFLQEYRLAPNNIYNAEVYPELPWLKKLPGVNFATLGYYGPKGVVSEDELRKAVSDLKKRRQSALDAGIPESSLYHYSWDEYGPFSKVHFDPATAKRYIEIVKAEIPGLKMMQTSLPVPPFDQWWNVWVPVMSEFRHMNPEVLKKPGSEAWWYWVSDPRPYPNFFLGYPVHESRMALMTGFKYHLKGVLYWCINREWPENGGKALDRPEVEWAPKYNNIFTKKDNLESGQGNLVYPGPEGRLWPSIRLENVRDGIEDFEYLAILERLAGEIRSGKRKEHQGRLAEIDALLAIPDEVVKSTAVWTRDPAILSSFRDKVASMIETIVKNNPIQEPIMKKEKRIWSLAAGAVLSAAVAAAPIVTQPLSAKEGPAFWLDIPAKVEGALTEKAAAQKVILKNPGAASAGVLRVKKGDEAKVASTPALAGMTKDLTVSMWYAVKGVDENYQTLLFKGDRSAKPERIQYSISLNYGYPEFKWKDAKGDWQGLMRSSAEAKTGAIKDAWRSAPGEWAHLAVTYSAGSVVIYVNGVKNAALAVKDKELVGASDELFLGVMAWSGGDRNYWMDGVVADLRIHASALSADEVKAVYSEKPGRAGTKANLP